MKMIGAVLLVALAGLFQLVFMLWFLGCLLNRSIL